MVQQWLFVVTEHDIMPGCGVMVAVHSVARQVLGVALTKFSLRPGQKLGGLEWGSVQENSLALSTVRALDKKYLCTACSLFVYAGWEENGVCQVLPF